MTWHPNVLVIGEPGSGKSVAAARDAVEFPGAAIILDPHKNSLAELVLMHADGNILFDRIFDLEYVLCYGLLKPSRHAEPQKRLQQNLHRAQTFVEFLMRRRGGDAATSPLLEEWIMALLMLFLYQRDRKTPNVIPYGFMPGTTEFRALLSDCTLEEYRHKFQPLEKLNARALRAEIGSAARLINPVFRAPEFLKRCRAGFDVEEFLRQRGKLVIERGDANEDVNRIIMGGIIMLVTEFCENRPVPHPPCRIYLDECTNARTAGNFEERKAGETRKYGLSWYFMCQWPNFPNGPEGFYQNCNRKEIYRTGHYDLARKLATMAAPGFPSLTEETHPQKVARLAAAITNFQSGQRLVTDRTGSRIEYLPMLENPWPDWPGLREAKLQEKIQWIRSRPEYRRDDEPSSETSSTPETPRSPRSRDDSSPAARLKRRGKKPADGSASNGDAAGST
jgi:hypothetical protein